MEFLLNEYIDNPVYQLFNYIMITQKTIKDYQQCQNVVTGIIKCQDCSLAMNPSILIPMIKNKKKEWQKKILLKFVRICMACGSKQSIQQIEYPLFEQLAKFSSDKKDTFNLNQFSYQKIIKSNTNDLFIYILDAAPGKAQAEKSKTSDQKIQKEKRLQQIASQLYKNNINIKALLKVGLNLEDIIYSYARVKNCDQNNYYKIAIELNKYTEQQFNDLLNDIINKKLDDPSSIIEFQKNYELKFNFNLASLAAKNQNHCSYHRFYQCVQADLIRKHILQTKESQPQAKIIILVITDQIKIITENEISDKDLKTVQQQFKQISEKNKIDPNIILKLEKGELIFDVNKIPDQDELRRTFLKVIQKLISLSNKTEFNIEKAWPTLFSTPQGNNIPMKKIFELTLSIGSINQKPQIYFFPFNCTIDGVDQLGLLAAKENMMVNVIQLNGQGTEFQLIANPTGGIYERLENESESEFNKIEKSLLDSRPKQKLFPRNAEIVLFTNQDFEFLVSQKDKKLDQPNKKLLKRGILNENFAQPIKLIRQNEQITQNTCLVQAQIKYFKEEEQELVELIVGFERKIAKELKNQHQIDENLFTDLLNSYQQMSSINYNEFLNSYSELLCQIDLKNFQSVKQLVQQKMESNLGDNAFETLHSLISQKSNQ